MFNANKTNDEWQLMSGITYLNHAAVAPWPQRTKQAVINFANENSQFGAKQYPQWRQVEKQLRQQIAALIHAPSPDDIALLKNTSEALSTIAYGLDWQAGDNIVISNQEFPSNRIVWQSLTQQGVITRQADLLASDSPEQALMDQCDSKTRLLSISSVQYATGLRVNLERLGKYCAKQGILFCIDAIQSIGALSFDSQQYQADFVVADGHKWMLGPEGLALFYCKSKWREQLKLCQYGWHMTEKYDDFDQTEWQPASTARRFECGSPNMLSIHALNASLSLLLEVGMDNIEQKILSNSEYMFEQLAKSQHLTITSVTKTDQYAGIIAFRHHQVEQQKLHQHLTKQGVVCAIRNGSIRFSPHYYTPRSELQKAIDIADELIN